MKKTLIGLLFLLPAGFLFAQNRHDRTPEPVQQAFHKDYPDANNTRWSKSNGQWHASFDDHSPRGRGEMVAHYDQNGRHIESHIYYNPHDVPTPVVTKVQSRYRGGRDYRYTKIERPGSGAFFQVQVNHRGRDRTLYLDEQGQERKYQDHR